MTTTDIGILLVVLCILLWAIMAALHRHTVQMQALKEQMQELLKLQQARKDGSGGTAATGRDGHRDDSDAGTGRTQADTATFKVRR